MKPLVVIGVDPGKKTGICYLDVDEDGEIRRQVIEVGRDDVAKMLAAWMINSDPDADREMAVERYTILDSTVRKTRQPDALKVIGVAEDIARQAGFGFSFHAPADCKKLVTDDLLKRLGWYSTRLGHANDATRPALRTVLLRRATVFFALTRQPL
jgi:hypothetical protein